MPGVDAVFERVSLEDGNLFAIRVPRASRNEFWAYVNAVEKKSKFFRVQLSPPAKPITRGYRSQMARHWGHCGDIAEQKTTEKRTYTKEMIDRSLRVMAVREHFPTQYDDVADVVEPIHMSQCTVEDANLIEHVKQRYCDEHEYWLTEYHELPDKKLIPYRSIGGRTYAEMQVYWKEHGAA